jgi:Tfp pilus assembly protein PilF
LDTRHSLAFIQQAQGQLDAADREYRAVINVQRRLLGDDHPNTLVLQP